MSWARLGKWSIVVIVASAVFILLAQIAGSLNNISKLNIDDNNLLFQVDHRFLEDTRNELDLASALIKLSNQASSPLNVVKTEFGPHAYWYRIELTNLHRNENRFVALFDNPMLDEIEVWVLDNKSDVVQTKLMGDSIIANEIRDMALPNLKLSIAERETVTLIVKTKTLGAPNVPIAIFHEKDYKRYVDAIYILWGAFIGTCLVIFVYNLILFMGTSERVFLYYMGYVAAFLIELGVVHGYLFYILPTEVALWFGEHIIVVNFILAFCSIMFALHFLKYNEQTTSLLTRLTYFISTVYLLGALFALFIPEYKAAMIFFSLQVVLYVIAVSMMVQRLKQGVRWANYYVISWVPLLVGAAVGPLLLTGHLEYNLWTRHALLLGVMFEVTFMSMALAQRLRTAETERYYQSSHEQRFGFANDQLLEESIERLIDAKNPEFSIVLISLDNFDNYVPYLRKEHLAEVIYNIAFDLESRLKSDLLLAEIDKNSKFKNLSMIRDGVFAFVVVSNDEFLLKSVFQRFSESQPLTYDVNGLTLNFNCYASAIEYTEQLTIYELTNQALQQIEHVRDTSGTFSIYTESTHSENLKRIQLASDLQKAINDSSLELYHQPQLSLKTGHVSGSEVLLRWNHEQFGFIPPPEFIKVAEDTGVINKLSRWVFLNACKHLVELKNLGHVDHRVSVNVSVYDIMSEGFIAYLVECLGRFNLRTDDFIIELTETAATQDTKVFSKNLLELKDLGFVISIDDFGTGYSSLTYISKHPFDELKIDREFVQNIANSKVDLNITKSTLALAKSLNYKVVAEGIEDKDTLSVLKNMGCDFAQGYYYSKPLPLEQYIDWLEEQELKEELDDTE